MRRSGFTLLELLLASSLFVLLVSVVYTCYISASRTVLRCQEGFLPFRDGLKAERVLRRVLASASSSRQKNIKAIFNGEESRLVFTTLNRQGLSAEQPCPVAYVRITQDSTDGLTVLYHPTYFLLDKDDPANGQRVKFPTVTALKMEYAEKNDWVRDWDATKKGKLPTRVKIKLTLQGQGTAPLDWQMVIPVPIQSDVPITAAPPPSAPPPAGGPGQAPGGPGNFPVNPVQDGNIPVEPTQPTQPTTGAGFFGLVVPTEGSGGRS